MCFVCVLKCSNIVLLMLRNEKKFRQIIVVLEYLAVQNTVYKPMEYYEIEKKEGSIMPMLKLTGNIMLKFGSKVQK